MKPLISICIPNYNHGSLLKQTLDAVFNQDLTDVEVIISDNASTDTSLDVISQFEHKAQLTLLKQPQTVSMSAHWNKVVQAAKGQWVIMLCADDLLLADSISRLKNIVSANEVQAVFFEYDFLINDIRTPKTAFYQDNVIIPGSAQSEIFLKSNNFPLTACMFQKQLLQNIGWFDQTKNFCTDWHAWLNMSAMAKQVAYVKAPLFLYRKHEENETNRCVQQLIALDEVIAMKDEFIEKYQLSNANLIRGVILNSLKLANRYRDEMHNNGLLKEAAFYQAHITELENKLSQLTIDEPEQPSGSAPYAPPAGSILLNA